MHLFWQFWVIGDILELRYWLSIWKHLTTRFNGQHSSLHILNAVIKLDYNQHVVILFVITTLWSLLITIYGHYCLLVSSNHLAMVITTAASWPSCSSSVAALWRSNTAVCHGDGHGHGIRNHGDLGENLGTWEGKAGKNAWKCHIEFQLFFS